MKIDRKIFFVRKFKAWSIRMHIHGILSPFISSILYVAYMALFSEWCAKHSDLIFNDFYRKQVRYEDRFRLHKFLVQHEKLNTPIVYLEFGVASGISIKWWLKQNTNPQSLFFGFDIFTGLPENWGLLAEGVFDQGGQIPEVGGDERCHFIPGLFQDTLIPFLKSFERDNRRLVLHLDADLYSSTLFVLTTLAPIFRDGDILIFDEFGSPLHEFRAFKDFFGSYYMDYEVLGAVNNFLQVSVKIVNQNSEKQPRSH